MAIQTINLGSMPLGAGGDTQRAANTKINENFSNATHAASRLVGTGNGQVPVYTTNGISGLGVGATLPRTLDRETTDLPQDLATGFYKHASASNGLLGFTSLLNICYSEKQNVQLIFKPDLNRMLYRRTEFGVVKGEGEIYTTLNTTKDSATGFLKASSPVLHVYNDTITKIHEAEQLDITVDKKGVGHYEIHGTTGLRKNDGWFMSPPRDVHGNVLCMVDLEEKDGVIILRTYKKKFDFETVSIVHDYDNPMDIPDGVCVEFRFNDLPEGELDEPIE